MISLFLALEGKNQTIKNIEGITTDSLLQPVIGVSVIIYGTQSDKMLGFSITNNEGIFKIVISTAEKQVVVKINALGYQRKIINVDISGGDTNFGRVILERSTQILKEVIVVSKPSPVKQRGDTTEYNANAFKDASTKIHAGMHIIHVSSECRLV